MSARTAWICLVPRVAIRMPADDACHLTERPGQSRAERLRAGTRRVGRPQLPGLRPPLGFAPDGPAADHHRHGAGRPERPIRDPERGRCGPRRDGVRGGGYRCGPRLSADTGARYQKCARAAAAAAVAGDCLRVARATYCPLRSLVASCREVLLPNPRSCGVPRSGHVPSDTKPCHAALRPLVMSSPASSRWCSPSRSRRRCRHRLPPSRLHRVARRSSSRSIWKGLPAW